MKQVHNHRHDPSELPLPACIVRVRHAAGVLFTPEALTLVKIYCEVHVPLMDVYINESDGLDALKSV
jgi:hypothetical protein